MVAPYEGVWLQAMNKSVGALQSPVRVRLVPHTVEPDAAYLPVLRKQFRQLCIHEIEVTVEVAARRTPGEMSVVTQWPVIGIVPVHLRVVEKKLYALPMCF